MEAVAKTDSTHRVQSPWTTAAWVLILSVCGAVVYLQWQSVVRDMTALAETVSVIVNTVHDIRSRLKVLEGRRVVLVDE
jgi:hypothetical protein